MTKKFVEFRTSNPPLRNRVATAANNCRSFFMIQMNYKDWRVSFRVSKNDIAVYKGHDEVKSIPSGVFSEFGMMTFPEELYKEICIELRAANVYDSFLEKFQSYEEGFEDAGSIID